MKKRIACILGLTLVLGLAGCGTKEQAPEEVQEEITDDKKDQEAASDTWYEVDQEAGILTVRLPAEKEGFIWDFTINDTALLKLVTEEDNDGIFVASFRALGDGETVVSFSYAKDDALEEIRALNVTCKDGEVAGVSNASIMSVSGQDDPEIADLGLAGCGTKEQAPEEKQEEITDDKKEQKPEESHSDIDGEANDKSAQPADWYELQEEGYVLTLKLEDPEDDAYEWVLQNHYETVIQVEDEKHEDGMYIISLLGAMQEFGDAQIALQYTDAWDEQVQDTVVMDLFVNESGEIFVETASRT